MNGNSTSQKSIIMPQPSHAETFIILLDTLLVMRVVLLQMSLSLCTYLTYTDTHASTQRHTHNTQACTYIRTFRLSFRARRTYFPALSCSKYLFFLGDFSTMYAGGMPRTSTILHTWSFCGGIGMQSYSITPDILSAGVKLRWPNGYLIPDPNNTTHHTLYPQNAKVTIREN